MAVILLGNLEQYRKGPRGCRPGVKTVPIGAHCGRPLHPFAQLRQKSLKVGVINVIDREIHSYSCRSGLPQNSLPRRGTSLISCSSKNGRTWIWSR